MLNKMIKLMVIIKFNIKYKYEIISNILSTRNIWLRFLNLHTKMNNCWFYRSQKSAKWKHFSTDVSHKNILIKNKQAAVLK